MPRRLLYAHVHPRLISILLLLFCSFSFAQINSNTLDDAENAIDKGRINDALQILQVLYNDDPNNLHVTNNYAVALTLDKRSEEAGLILQRALLNHQELGIIADNLFQLFDYFASDAYAQLNGEMVSIPVLALYPKQLSPEQTKHPLERQSSHLPPLLSTPTINKPMQSPSSASAASTLEEQIQWLVKTHAQAWEAGALNEYSKFYMANQSPVQNISHDTWLSDRQQKIYPNRNIHIDIDNFKLLQSNEKTAVSQHHQRYTARDYSDSCIKKFTWIKHNGQWKILSESQQRL